MFRLVLVLVTLGVLLAPANAGPPVYVVLWFDTEDYVLPASDDAALKVADWLTKEGIRATFKVVGEKARTLEQRGRQDVIDALKKHEIGYHSNYHSVQPTPAQYLAPLGWDEGVAAFDRREKPGYDDVKRIFGQDPSCYGQPGSSWGPQSFGALRKWGTPVYLDAGSHVRLDGKPHYYGGILTLYSLAHVLRTNLDGEKSLQQAQDRFADAHKKLTAEGGGIVSIYYHPCEFVHRQFWDGANFSKGANPPREQWKLPEAKSAEETRIAYETFNGYIQYIKRLPDVKFITAREARHIYRDKALIHNFTPAQVQTLAKGVGSAITHQRVADVTLAPSEILYLLNKDLVAKADDPTAAANHVGPTPVGPTSPPPAMAKSVTTDKSQFLRTAKDVMETLRTQGRVPGTVWLGSTGVTPEAYLSTLAKIVADGKGIPQTVDVAPATLAAAKYVANDDPKLWGWVIFPPEFKAAPAMMDLAKRQAWTIKPAVLHK